MGEAQRKREQQEVDSWSDSERYDGIVDLHVLPPSDNISAADCGIPEIPDSTGIVLRAFKVFVGDRSFHAGFCLGDATGFSQMGARVVQRILEETGDAAVHVVPIAFEDIAWDLVLQHLRTFSGQIIIFAFADSDIYDAGTATLHYSNQVRQFGHDGEEFPKLTKSDRQEIRHMKAEALDRLPPPAFAPIDDVTQEELPWIYAVGTPSGQKLRVAVWNGRRNFIHEIPVDIGKWVGGKRIALVQVGSPVGKNRRSSLHLTQWLAKKGYDGVVHWARDTETFESIVRSFERLGIPSATAPELPADWEPEYMIFEVNDGD